MTSPAATFFESMVRALAEREGFSPEVDVERTPDGVAYRVVLWDDDVEETVSFRVSERDVAAARLNTRDFDRALALQVESARRRVDQRILGPQPEETPDFFAQPRERRYGPW